MGWRSGGVPREECVGVAKSLHGMREADRGLLLRYDMWRRQRQDWEADVCCNINWIRMMNIGLKERRAWIEKFLSVLSTLHVCSKFKKKIQYIKLLHKSIVHSLRSSNLYCHFDGTVFHLVLLSLLYLYSWHL